MHESQKAANILDAQKGVVLRDALAPCGCTSLDLADTESNGKVGDDSVLGLTTSVGDHDTPSIRLCELSTVVRVDQNDDR